MVALVMLAIGIDVLGLVLGRGFRLTLAGLVAGAAGSVFASRYMASKLHGVAGFDPLSTAVAVGVLLAATAAASLVPAWRATRVDPTIALRHE